MLYFYRLLKGCYSRAELSMSAFSPRPVTRLRRLWRGDLPLAEAFWKWAVLGGLIVNGVTTALFVALIIADRPVAAVAAGYAFSVPYNILAAVAVWRSAGAYTGGRRWADLARIVAVVGLALLSIT